MRVLVCGGRDFTDEAFVRRYLLEFMHDDEDISHGSTVITGGAKGVDRMAHHWALGRGCFTEVYHANWDKYDKAAGPIRNQQMLDEGKPDVVIAFPGGRGTADMVARAKKAGVKVIEIP